MTIDYTISMVDGWCSLDNAIIKINIFICTNYVNITKPVIITFFFSKPQTTMAFWVKYFMNT